jgi:exodeoxyribonuclease V alpha subunit
VLLYESLVKLPRSQQRPVSHEHTTAVIIPLLTQHYAMLQRNLLYTGVTRGKRLVVLVGQKKAVAIAVRNASGRRRWSKLKSLMEIRPSEW